MAELRFVLVMPGRELVLSAFSFADKDMWWKAVELTAASGVTPATDEHLVREGWMWKQKVSICPNTEQTSSSAVMASYRVRACWLRLTQALGFLM